MQDTDKKMEVTITMSEKEAELFVNFRRYQKQWERLVGDDKVNSVHIHKDPATLCLSIFEWFEKEKI